MRRDDSERKGCIHTQYEESSDKFKDLALQPLNTVLITRPSRRAGSERTGGELMAGKMDLFGTEENACSIFVSSSCIVTFYIPLEICVQRCWAKEPLFPTCLHVLDQGHHT